LGVHDFPEPACQAALIKATALSTLSANGKATPATPPVSIIGGTPEGNEFTLFAKELADALKENDIEVFLCP
jgi:hypothetical protein